MQHIQLGSPAILQEVMAGFLAKTGINGVIGVIDGWVIPMERPRGREQEQACVNRTGFHSINLMAACGVHRKFLDVCIGWPGSVHDARVWRNLLWEGVWATTRICSHPVP